VAETRKERLFAALWGMGQTDSIARSEIGSVLHHPAGLLPINRRAVPDDSCAMVEGARRRSMDPEAGGDPGRRRRRL
jgi:hypothetical protein